MSEGLVLLTTDVRSAVATWLPYLFLCGLNGELQPGCAARSLPPWRPPQCAAAEQAAAGRSLARMPPTSHFFHLPKFRLMTYDSLLLELLTSFD